MVSKGMIRVATITESSTPRPLQSRKTKENAASEQSRIESTTVTMVIPTEFIMNSPIGTRSKAL